MGDRNRDLERARDELYAQIHRCGVLKADADHQREWLDDTMEYMAETFPDLQPEDLAELRTIGERFCAPPIPHGKEYTQLTRESWEGQEPDTQPREGADHDHAR
jgi:hypothetical protein